MSLFTTLLIASIVVLVFVLISVIKNRMNIRYAMIWIVLGVIMILMSLFPNSITSISKALGIQVGSNTVFLIYIFLLYCLTFYIYLKISLHNEEITDLNYEIAVLKKRIEELEKK